MKSLGLIVLMSTVALNSWAQALAPAAPADRLHPGSKVYQYTAQKKNIVCMGRNVDIFVPVSTDKAEAFPVVVYGHGQALGLDSYLATLEHLAKKGVIAIFPTYDNGFFDQDWIRMGRDYVNLTACALQSLGSLALNNSIVFSGHSKGAYVAQIAAGLAVKESLQVRAQSLVLFAVAGAEIDSLEFIEPTTEMTLVFSDRDSTVKKELTQSIYDRSRSLKKQIITLKSYGNISADHFWPLTRKSFVGGGPEGALHYFGSWKWLVAAALDLKDGGAGANPYLYANEAVDKGVVGFQDELLKNY